MIRAPLIAAALLLPALPTIAQAEVRQPRTLLAMAPADFAQATTLHDDALESHATLSTEKAHREGWKFLKPFGHDNHLRAIVDKKTGATRFEVRQALRYWGAQRDYQQVHYIGPRGLQKVVLSEAQHGADVCPTTENMIDCPLSKTMAFEVDEHTVRKIAADYQPGTRQRSWAFKLKDQTGHDIHSGIVPAEAAGLLQAVDRYKAGLSVS